MSRLKLEKWTPINGTSRDVGHFGPQFGPFHLSILKQFEDSLCAILGPDFPGAPYWGIQDDCKGTVDCPGTYYNAPNSVTAEIFFGTMNGNPDNLWQADTAFYGGILAGTPIKPFNWFKWPKLSQYYNGSKVGLMRSPDDEHTEPWALRYDTANVALVPGTGEPRASMGLGLDMPYSRKDYLRCANASLVKSVTDWSLCIDCATTGAMRLGGDPYVVETWANELSCLTHISFHNIMGSFGDPFNTAKTMGEARVVNTSPNEYMAFFLHHNSVVRNFQMWMDQSLKFNATMDNPDVLWDFPKQASTDPNDVPFIMPGTALDDVISPIMPFTDIMGFNIPRGVTFRDVMSFDWDKLYTFDTMNANEPCRPTMIGLGNA
ncbi:hypothetical protein FOA52_012422 [Chlamydomonas sp. UWO 241]|nr:hypothetical protein FOA52_012422 [Chlamydomonas sp. UWO 241]